MSSSFMACCSSQGSPASTPACIPLVAACSTPDCCFPCVVSAPLPVPHTLAVVCLSVHLQDQWPPPLPGPLAKDEEPFCAAAPAQGHGSEAQHQTGERQGNAITTAWWGVEGVCCAMSVVLNGSPVNGGACVSMGCFLSESSVLACSEWKAQLS